MNPLSPANLTKIYSIASKIGVKIASSDNFHWAVWKTLEAIVDRIVKQDAKIKDLEKKLDAQERGVERALQTIDSKIAQLK